MRRSNSPWEKQGHFSKKRWKALTLFVATSVLTAVFWEQCLLTYGDWLSYSTYTGQADIAVAPNISNGRLETAIEMHLDGEVSTIVTVSTFPYKVREQVEQRKIDPSNIHVGECLSFTTFSDASNAKEAVQNSELRGSKIVVVTDKYAMRRMQWIFQKVFGEDYKIFATDAVDPNSAKHKARTERFWWRNPISRQYVVEETQKNIFYRFYYGVLGRESEWNISFSSTFDWFSDWRVRDSKSRNARHEQAKERHTQRCNRE